MNRELWKDCLETFPYELVVSLIAATKTKVPGFRNPIPQSIFPMARSRIYTALLNNPNALLRKSKLLVENNEWEAYRTQSIQELSQLVSQNPDALPAILLSLLTSDATEHAPTARLLLDKLPTIENQGTPEEEDEKEQTSEQDVCQKQDDNDAPVKIRQLEKKLARLTEKLNTFESLNADLQSQNRNLKEELAALKRENAALNDRYSRESQDWNKERLKLEQLTQQEVAISHTQKTGTEVKQVIIHTRTPRVVLIGEKNKHLEDLSQTLRYQIYIYDSKEINQENNKVLEDCDEIWILKRDLSISQRRKIERQFKDRVTIFDNLPELDNHVAGGNRS